MIFAFTTKDKINISEFNSPILLIDTTDNFQKEDTYINAMKIADVLVTSHLDGFASEDIKKHGVTPIIYRGTIQNAINDLKDSEIKRTLPVGDNGGSCGI